MRVAAKHTILRALAECHRVVLHSPDEREVAHGICRIVVEIAAYAMAWVGYAEPDEARTIVPLAQVGIDRESLTKLGISYAEGERGRSAVGTAIRTGEVQIVPDLRAPHYEPWREVVGTRGWRSAAAFPLITDGRPFGVLTVCAVEPDAFTDEAVTLLGALAIDLAFGITSRRIHEDRLRVALASLDVAVFTQDPSLRYTWMYRPQLGFRGEEVVGRLDAELLPAEAARQATAIKRRALDQGSPARGEVRVEAPGGRIHDYELSAEPLREPDGKIRGIVGASIDVTHRKRVERALVESRDRLARILDRMSTLVVLMTPDGVIAEINDASLVVLGGDRERLVGTPCTDLPSFAHPSASGPELANAIARAGRGESVRCHLRLHAGGDRMIIVDTRIEPLVDGTGRVVELVGSGIDVTQEFEAHQALLASEERFRALVENTLDLTAVIGLDGSVRLLSRSVETTIGYAPTELVGRPVLSYVHPDDAAAVTSALAELADKPDAVTHIALRIRHRDGSYRTIQAVGKNLQHVPAIGGILVNGRDVTEQVAAETRLRQAEKVEAIGLLASGVAHDFNNLLAVILGNAELVLEATTEAETRTLVDEVRVSAQRAADLTARLRTFSRRGPERRQAVDLNALVREVIALVSRTIDRRIAIDAQLTATLPPMSGDLTQVQSAILNLAINARDAMPEGGRLTFSTCERTVDATGAWPDPVAPGTYVEVSVRDTGAGIAPEVQAHIFEPFFTTKALEMGTGLGLTAVRACARAQRGSVAFETELGRGTTFRMILPCSNSPPVPSAVESRPAVRTGTGRAFVVDDDDMVRRVTVRALAALGYTVAASSDSDEALEELLRAPERHDVVLLDLNMPRRSGLDVLRAIRDVAPSLPVILCSGYAPSAVSKRLLEDPHTSLLTKPFTIAELSAAVSEALRAAR